MAERGLVVELPRQAGQHDRRWAHCLGETPAASPAVAQPVVDRDVVLADGPEVRDERVRASYGAIAADYADRFVDELLDGQPFETWLLGRVAAHAGRWPRRRGRLRAGARHGLPR